MRSAANTYGSDAGSRSSRSVCQREACIARK